MKLYYVPAACSFAVHAALLEVGREVELVRVDLATGRTADGGRYLDVAPRGYVPLLVMDDGSAHTEAASLLQYVADLDPLQRLIGRAGTSRRLAVVEWLTFVATELHANFAWLFRRDTPAATRDTVKDKLARHFGEMNDLLRKWRWLAGDAASVADLYAYAVLAWTKPLQLPMDTFPALCDYMARVAARPHVRAALVAEGLVPVAYR